MEYKSTTFNSFEKSSKLFFPSVFTVFLSLLPFYVKFEQLNVNKRPKRTTELSHVFLKIYPYDPTSKFQEYKNWVWFNVHAK